MVQVKINGIVINAEGSIEVDTTQAMPQPASSAGNRMPTAMPLSEATGSALREAILPHLPSPSRTPSPTAKLPSSPARPIASAAATPSCPSTGSTKSTAPSLSSTRSATAW